MNPSLGKEVNAALRKSRMSSRELASRIRDAVGDTERPSESWVKQLRGGRTDTPNPEWLRVAAEELGADPARWLAMSSQLGASVGSLPPRLDPYAVLDRHATAMLAQAQAFDKLATSIDRAADRVTGRVEDATSAFEDVVRALRTLLPKDGASDLDATSPGQ